MNTQLLTEIDEFQERTGWSDYKIGFQAVRNGRLVERLRSGRRVWPETEKAVRDFMVSQETKKGVSA